MAVSSRKSSDANDFSMEEKIVALYELQKIDSKIDEINKLKGELPLEVQDLEDEIAGLDTRIANITAEVDELNKATKQYKDAIDQSKTLIAKYEGQQDNVRNNREFDALSKAQSQRAAAKIDDRLLAAYKRIRHNVRNGLAVVTVKRDACGGCYNRIPPQRQMDIRMSKKVIVCEYCGRILVSNLLDDEEQQ